MSLLRWRASRAACFTAVFILEIATIRTGVIATMRSVVSQFNHDISPSMPAIMVTSTTMVSAEDEIKS